MENNYTYLKLLQSKDISFWDVIRLSFSQKKLSNKFPLVKLGKIISPRKEKIKKTEYKGEEQIVSKISFNDGKLHLRADKATGMDLYRLYKSDLLVSNINFHQGAVAINNIDILACSTHYQPYIVDYTIVDPQYLILILRNQQFLNYVVKQKTNGIKTESKYNFIKELEIPLPSIEKQKELVAEYERIQNLAQQKVTEAEQLEKSIDDYLLIELGIKGIEEQKSEKNLFKIIQYRTLNKWELDKIYQLEAKYPIVSFGNNTNVVQSIKRGKSPHYSEHGNCFAINQKCVRKHYIDMTYVKKIDQMWCDKIDTEYKTKEGDILINSTGEGTIGRAAIVNKETNYIYDSHILNLRLNKTECFPRYFLRLFNTELLQKQVDLYKSGTSTKQTELGVDNLKKISFPLPPIEIQHDIVMKIENKEKQIIMLRNESEQLKQQAISNFEQKVFN